LSIKRSGKSIKDISDRLRKLEAGDGASEITEAEKEVQLELEVRYARYREEKAEKWKRLGREPTYHESWAELTLSEYAYILTGTGTPEERHRKKKEHWYFHECSSYDGVTGGTRDLVVLHHSVFQYAGIMLTMEG
jgi:hypothetical protein